MTVCRAGHLPQVLGCSCPSHILPAFSSPLHTWVVLLQDWLCPRLPWLSQPCSANVRPLKWAKPLPFQEPGSGYCRGPHSGPSCIGSFYRTPREQRSGLFLKGQLCNPSEHADLKGPDQAREAVAVVTLLPGQEKARDVHPGEQISGNAGDVRLRADPCSVF